MNGAGQVLQAAAMAALQQLEELGAVYPGTPLQGAFPHALVEPGIEVDWSHKSGMGREVRLFVTVRDQAERPDRLQALKAGAEAALDGFAAELEGWTLASFQFVRSRTAVEMARGSPPGWAAVSEYRARMLATAV